MSKLIIGLIIGVLLAIPAGAFAWSSQQEATPLKAVGCSHTVNGDVVEPNSCRWTVDRFDDRDNTCYVVRPDIAISCVKKEKS